MRKALILLLMTAFFGLLSCDGGFVDPGAMEYGAGELGGLGGGSGFSGGGGRGSGAINGTWVMTEGGKQYTWVFNNGTYVLSSDGSEWRRGTYTISGSNISIATTHIKGWVLAGDNEYETQFGPNILPDQWYTKQDLYNFWLNAAYAESIEKGNNFTKAEIDQQIGGVMNSILDSSLFKLMEGTYKLSGNTLVITSKDDDEDTITFTRQR
jgi:hypothetical protein